MEKKIRVRYPKNTRVKKNCVICGKEMVLIMSKANTRKVCSKECRSKLQSIYSSSPDHPLKKGVKMIKEVDNAVYFQFNRSDKVGIIDKEDWEKIKKYSWRVLNNHQSRGYIGNLYGSGTLWDIIPKKKVVLLHRFILGIHLENGAISKKQVDHINGNGLDNRKSNLRLVTQAQNNCNQYKGAHGKYPNIRWNNTTGKFIAEIKIETQRVNLGKDFNTPDEAMEAYNKAREEFVLTGTLSILNK